MTKLHSFKDHSGACYANIRMENGDPIFISVAQTGVVVKKSKLGLFGSKLYQSQTVYDAANTTQALHALYPDYIGAVGVTNPSLRAFTNAALHCSTTAEVAMVLNTASEKVAEEEKLQAAVIAIISAYGDVLVEVSEQDHGKYPAAVYPQSLLPIPKDALSNLLAIEIEATSDSDRRRRCGGIL